MGGKLPRAGDKIPRRGGGQAAQGDKINCYTGTGEAARVTLKVSVPSGSLFHCDARDNSSFSVNIRAVCQVFTKHSLGSQ